MTYGTVNADKMTNSDNVTSGGLYGFKNRIINGAMVIDQRNAGASVATSSSGAVVYTLDRWAYAVSQASKFTIQQTPSATETGYATRVGAGFTNYLACTVGASANVTVGSSDYFLFRHNIEGFNTSDFAWGTANAKTVTLSFWAYSSVTGTFGGVVGNSANTRAYPFTYTINSASTWEQKTITIAGDTSGTWVGATNGIGLKLSFSLGMGSTYSATANAWATGEYYSATGAISPITTNSATFYITGVQLEKGSTATSFDYRPFTTELILCQRYYTRFNCGTAFGRILPFALGIGGTLVRPPVQLPVRMRAAASSVDYGGALVWYNGATTGVISAVSIDTANDTIVGLNCTTTGATASQAYMINDSGANTAFIGINAEL